MEVMEMQFSKALLPRVLTVAGMRRTPSRRVQPRKAPLLMLSSPSGSWTEVICVHPLKALLPMEVTPSGMTKVP